MSTIAIEPYLVDHPLFTWLDHRYIRFLAENAEQLRYNPNDYIFEQGEIADHFYIIIHGRVAIEAHKPEKHPLVIQTISDGDVLGWSWLFAPYTRQLSAKALEHTTVIALDAKYIRTKCEEDHNLGYEIMKRFASVILQRLHALSEEVIAMHTPALTSIDQKHFTHK